MMAQTARPCGGCDRTAAKEAPNAVAAHPWWPPMLDVATAMEAATVLRVAMMLSMWRLQTGRAHAYTVACKTACMGQPCRGGQVGTEAAVAQAVQAALSRSTRHLYDWKTQACMAVLPAA